MYTRVYVEPFAQIVFEIFSPSFIDMIVKATIVIDNNRLNRKNYHAFPYHHLVVLSFVFLSLLKSANFLRT